MPQTTYIPIINWDDPTERANLIQHIGPQEYNTEFAKHQEQIIIKIIAGHPIRPVNSQFGKLFQQRLTQDSPTSKVVE